MKSIVKVLVPVTLAFGAIGAASAQTIETDYPGPAVQTAASSAPSQAAPFLIQSNQGAVAVNPAYEQAPASRDEVRSEAGLSVPVGPGFNA
ncbi:MAG: hypothetical protein EHM83_03650 [Burkholderiales bacterium]|nr:MAG: hypothetical protein EHM83_03650 [Burkholderiales bacterium]